MKEEKQHCQKKSYQSVGFDLKLKIVEQVSNSQISINHAATKYNINRNSIYYWLKKFSKLKNKKVPFMKVE